MYEPVCSLRLAGITDESIVDGPGLRLVVFVQGCMHACPGCHNPQTHDPDAGHLESIASVIQMYRQNPLLCGITFSGGEPFLQASALAALGDEIHALGGDVVTYTGFVYEDLLARQGRIPGCGRLLETTDLLIDGPFLLAHKSLDLEYRGSSNQRMLTKAQRRAISLSLQKSAA